MTTVTINLPEELRERTEQLASQQGSSIEHLIQKLLEEYLEEIEDAREAAEITKRIAASNERTYSHQEVWDTIDSLEQPGELPH